MIVLLLPTTLFQPLSLHSLPLFYIQASMVKCSKWHMFFSGSQTFQYWTFVARICHCDCLTLSSPHGDVSILRYGRCELMQVWEIADSLFLAFEAEYQSK